MTKNYYLHLDVCPHCGRPSKILHLGLSAVGWKFLFQAYGKDEFEEEDVKITSFSQWKTLINKRDSKIYDEYDHEVPKADFYEFVSSKQNGREHILNDAYQDEEGYDLTFGEFS